MLLFMYSKSTHTHDGTSHPVRVWATVTQHSTSQQLTRCAAVCIVSVYRQVMIDFFNSRLDSIKGNTSTAPEGQANWNVGRVLELVQTFAQVRRTVCWASLSVHCLMERPVVAASAVADKAAAVGRGTDRPRPGRPIWPGLTSPLPCVLACLRSC